MMIIIAAHPKRCNNRAEAEDPSKTVGGGWKWEEMGSEGEDLERRARVVHQRMEKSVQSEQHWRRRRLHL